MAVKNDSSPKGAVQRPAVIVTMRFAAPFSGRRGFRRSAEELFVGGQEVIDVAGAGVGVVRILDVEVVVAGFDFIDGETSK